jgi:DNA helicase-2/ATP-dependent DNA helicase PcrA
VWIEALSLARLGMRKPTDVESLYDGEVDGFAEVYPRYRAELARAGAVDFDEQIQLAIEILLTDPRARDTAQRACRMLLVDEFQDLTPAHLLLIRLLAGPDGAVFGVGDDDQTIYGYNGADPAWLIDFDALFPGAGDHPLEVNYRCPGDVVAAADMLLRHNSRRVAKIIRADRPAGGFTIEPGDAPVDTTVRIISEALAAGVPTDDIAVLTRVNSMLAPVQVALRQLGIATTGGVGAEFADRTAVRSALAWLRLAIAGEHLDPADLAEALRRPSRPMHPNIANWVGEQRSVDGLRRLVGRITTERDALRVDEFTDDIERLQRITRSRGTTAGLLGALRDSMGLATTIASLDTHRRGMNRAAQNDDLTAIAQLAELQPDPSEFERWLRAGLQRSSEAGGVTLATVHRVKGQEWPVVIVHQAADDQFPHRLADDIEEERRVFHVAITRASRQLHVVPDATPSPFIADCTTEPSARRSPPAATSRPVVSIPKSAATSAGKPGHDLTAAQSAVFEELRSLRRHLAAGKPAYTVFADAVLHEIAVAQPSTLGDLARIKGIGPNKLERYGSAILAVIESAESVTESVTASDA